MTTSHALLLFLLAGCAGPRADVSLQLFVSREAAWQGVLPDATLQTGEQILLRVEVAQKMHCYAVTVTAGRVQWLAEGWPGTPGRAIRIPRTGQRLSLSGSPGTEDVRVLLSRRPLRPEAALALLAVAPLWQVRDPPPDIPEKKRDPHSIPLRLSPQGTVAQRLLLRHDRVWRPREDAPAAADPAALDAPPASR